MTYRLFLFGAVCLSLTFLTGVVFAQAQLELQQYEQFEENLLSPKVREEIQKMIQSKTFKPKERNILDPPAPSEATRFLFKIPEKEDDASAILSGSYVSEQQVGEIKNLCAQRPDWESISVCLKFQ